MKKIFLIIVATTICNMVFAQGCWSVTRTEADELKGIKGGTAYAFTEESVGGFVLWDWETPLFRIYTSEGQFDIEAVSGMITSAVGKKALIGLYNDNGKLMEKIELWLDREENKANRFLCTRNASGMSTPTGQKSKVKKIFKALQSTEGYVRIVVPRFETSDFDLKITPYKKD